MTKFWWNAIGGAILALASVAVSAQSVHEGDIEVGVAGGRLVVEGAPRTEYGTGYGIFEGSLDTLLAGPRWRTTDPGFASEPGAFALADMLSFAPVGTLSFWNGSAWGAPDRAVLVVRDSLDETATYTGTGFTTSSAFDGFISDAGSTGQIHQHIVFTLQTSPLGIAAPVGAYRIAMQLASPSYDSSDPFWLVFNRGLAEEAFQASVQVMAVPEPKTYALMALGLAFVAFVARRRRAG